MIKRIKESAAVIFFLLCFLLVLYLFYLRYTVRQKCTGFAITLSHFYIEMIIGKYRPMRQ